MKEIDWNFDDEEFFLFDPTIKVGDYVKVDVEKLHRDHKKWSTWFDNGFTFMVNKVEESVNYPNLIYDRNGYCVPEDVCIKVGETIKLF